MHLRRLRFALHHSQPVDSVFQNLPSAVTDKCDDRIMRHSGLAQSRLFVRFRHLEFENTLVQNLCLQHFRREPFQ